jgi:outer membrane lipoprotein SlyB
MASRLNATLRKYTRPRGKIELGGCIMNRFQSGSGYERSNQWKPARERETTTIFSFRESILNHLHKVVGAVRRGVRCVEVGGGNFKV